MPHTDRTTVIAQYIVTQLDANKATWNVDHVLYGEHNNVPSGISVTVTSGTKSRNLEGVAFPGARTRNRMIVIITVYNNQMGDEASQRLIVDQTAEEIEHFLHQDTTLGDRVIHGFVDSWDPGVRFKSGSMFRVTQMIYIAQSKTNLTDIP